MPVTYNLIASNTLTTTAASVTFSAIPNTFTDLVLRVSARDTSDSPISEIIMRLNGETGFPTIYSNTYLQGGGGSVASGRFSNTYTRYILNNPGTYTSNTFNSLEMYFPNYAGNTNKPISIISMTENNNASDAYLAANAMLRSNTAAISSIALSSYTTFVSGSSFFLYGIKNS